MNNINETRFLSHLENSIPRNANNYMLSTYSIILEAWRRGLGIDISILKQKSGIIAPHYSISNGEKTHKFSVTRGDFVSAEAKKLVINKHSTKEQLLKNNVSTPDGKDFNNSKDNTEIVQYAARIGYPVVVKPLAGTGGKGVIANIQNEEELIEALEYVRDTLKSPHIILENYFEGDDYRLYVIDGKVIGAIKRVRAHVIGNGKDTVKQLVEKKNKERIKLPSLTDRTIKIDRESKILLRRQNLNLNSVIPQDELIELKSKNNISAGGDSVDITDEVSDKIKNIAIAAIESFPSLPQGGVDMIVDEHNDSGVVIEINSRAHITQHLFPMKGQARDIPTAIIDYYFPETKEYDREEPNQLYIDYDFIYNASLSRTASNIELPRLPESPIVLKRYVISDSSYTDHFAKRVRRLAFNNKVHGYIKLLKSSNIGIVAGGNENDVQTFVRQLKQYSIRNSKSSKLVEKNRKTPIKHGFHIIDADSDRTSSDDNTDTSNIYAEKYSKLKDDYQKLIKKLAEYKQEEDMRTLTEKQNKQLKKRLGHIEKSSSWKVTKPIRYIGSKFK